MSTHVPNDLEQPIREAIERGASDLFLIPGELAAIRRNGAIERIGEDVVSPSAVRRIAEAIVGAESLDGIGPVRAEICRSLYIPGVVNARVTIGRAEGDLTMSVGLQAYPVLDARKIAAPQSVLDAALSADGLIIFSGPAGSGKTTTLFSVADYINERRACHICTVEEPIMYRLTPKKALIQQREVGVDAPSFIAGIRASQSQGMDVLVLPEIRDLESLQALLTIGSLGTLALTQLDSARSPEESLERIVQVFPEDHRPMVRATLATHLRAACSQRLLKRASGQGVAPVYGVLIPDDEMRAAIREGRSVYDRTSPLPQGCTMLRDEIERLHAQKEITNEVAAEAIAGL